MLTTWDELLKKSESYSKLSKPEVLAVMDILKDSEELPFQNIFDTFTKNYQPDTNQRQLRYILSIMEENKLISKTSEGYSLNNRNITSSKSPISINESILLALSLIPVLITWNAIAFSLFTGIVLSISLHQIEYALSQRKKPKIDKFIEKML